MNTQQGQNNVSSLEQLKTERYLWIARAFSVVAVLSVVANMLLFFAISSLYPLVRIRPYYMTVIDKNQQVVEITPASPAELNDDKVIQSLIRQYVLARYTITQDVDELKERWGTSGIVYLMSSQDVYNAFEENQYDLLRREIEEEGLVANVKINSIIRKEANSPWWDVSLRWSLQTQSAVEPEVKELNDTLEVRFDPLYQKTNVSTWQDRLKNPLGFRVVNYGNAK